MANLVILGQIIRT